MGSEQREQSIEPQKIVFRPWNLMEFALLGFRLGTNDLLFFLASLFWNRNAYLMPVPLLYFGSK